MAPRKLLARVDANATHRYTLVMSHAPLLRRPQPRSRSTASGAKPNDRPFGRSIAPGPTSYDSVIPSLARLPSSHPDDALERRAKAAETGESILSDRLAWAHPAPPARVTGGGDPILTPRDARSSAS
jgi:hypothetical protein